MIAAATVYGLLAIVFALGLSRLRIADRWRLLMVPGALALAVAGFFVAGFVIGLLAWCVLAVLNVVVALIVSREELRAQSYRVRYAAFSMVVSLLTWPITFPFVTQSGLDEAGVSGAPGDRAAAMPTVRIETDGGSQRPDAGAFADVLGETLRGTLDGEPVELDVHDLGRLNLPSGRVIACDGFVLDGEPLKTSLPAGAHPVLVAVARLPDGDQRVAFARVQLADTPVTRWAAAGDGFAYGVDSGLGAFIAPEAIEAMQAEIPEHFEYVIQRMEETMRPSWSWARACCEDGNGILFSSGYGDGHYASYVGYDAAGVVTALLTSFDVVDWSPAPA